MANNPDKQAARSKALAQDGGNSLLSIAKFAEQYVAANLIGANVSEAMAGIQQVVQAANVYLPGSQQ